MNETSIDTIFWKNTVKLEVKVQRLKTIQTDNNYIQNTDVNDVYYKLYYVIVIKGKDRLFSVGKKVIKNLLVIRFSMTCCTP